MDLRGRSGGAVLQGRTSTLMAVDGGCGASRMIGAVAVGRIGVAITSGNPSAVHPGRHCTNGSVQRKGGKVMVCKEQYDGKVQVAGKACSTGTRERLTTQ